MKYLIFTAYFTLCLSSFAAFGIENLSEDEKWDMAAPGFRDYKCSEMLVDFVSDRKKAGSNMVTSIFYIWKNDQENRKLPTKKKVRELGSIAGSLCTQPQNMKRKVITIIDENY